MLLCFLFVCFSRDLICIGQTKPTTKLTVVCFLLSPSLPFYFSFQVRQPSEDESKPSTVTKEEKRSKSEEKGLAFGTLGRNKEKRMEQLRAKLHTDEQLMWLNHGKTLLEQSVFAYFSQF